MHSEIDQFADYSSSQLHKPVRKISEWHTNIIYSFIIIKTNPVKQKLDPLVIIILFFKIMN